MLRRVQYKDINTAVEMFDLDSYPFCFDLKGAYHHASINWSNEIFSFFSITEREVTKYFAFCVLPFGIATVGHSCQRS